MSKKRGFTLIELLVVIAIIALLMSILLPSLTRVRKQAKTTMCIMNLKTWGLLIQVYSNDNEGSMHGEHVGDSAWQSAYRDDYEDQPKIRCCPEAVKPGSEGGKQPFAAWGIFGPNHYYGFREGDYGSYGENGWIQNPTDTGAGEYFGVGFYWKTPNVKGASNVPAFLGCNWMHGVVNGSLVGGGSNPNNTASPEAPRFEGGPGGGCIERYMMNRHNGFVGSSFLDFSARKVGMKELFRVKWHRFYDINKWYEIEEAKPWPDWMANFKDY